MTHQPNDLTATGDNAQAAPQREILLALPLAVLLRMGPATVGATFSIDREPSFAMVTSRFGADSPQYRGVLSMYVFGSIFGAIIVSLVASVISATGIFDWRALAMGAGVGSGSMMAAGIASVTAAHPRAPTPSPPSPPPPT